MSNRQTQKEAVFNAVTNVLAEAGISINEGEDFGPHLTRELRAQVTGVLAEGFNNGTISLDKTFEDEAALRTYCSGVTSNWLRKDKRLNGGVKYIAKNPGSRVGSGDASLKAMRLLLSTVSSDSDRVEIQAAIDARVSEIKVSRRPAAVIDADALPESLRRFAK